MFLNFVLGLAAGEGKHLQDLKTMLGTVTVVGQQGIKKIELLRFDRRIFGPRKQRRHGELPLGVAVLRIIERAKNFRAMSQVESEFAILEKRPEGNGGAPVAGPSQQKNNQNLTRAQHRCPKSFADVRSRRKPVKLGA